MKKTKTILSLVIALIMVCTMSGASVFAAENGSVDQPADNDAQMDQNIDQGEGTIDENFDGTIEESSDDAIINEKTMQIQDEQATEDASRTRLATPTGIKVIPGFKSVKIKWNAVEGAEGYNVGWKLKSEKNWHRVAIVKGQSNTSVVKAGLKYRTNYQFRVMAVMLKNDGTIDYDGSSYLNAPTSTPSKPITQQTVKRLRISFTMKRTKKANGQTLKKGKRVWAEDFGLGKYTVYKKGKRLRVPRVMVKNIKASYKKRGDYGRESAEFFINKYMKDKKIKSSTKYTIWVSSYMQHLYVFKKTDGRWECVKDNKICMGRKTAPSPSGVKKIQKKISSRHGIRYWSCYSGLNALHGFKSSWSKKILGRLASGGCVRNWNSDAKWIYKNCPKGTRVIVY